MKPANINIEVTEQEAAVAYAMAKTGNPPTRSLGAKVSRGFILASQPSRPSRDTKKGKR